MVVKMPFWNHSNAQSYSAQPLALLSPLVNHVAIVGSNIIAEL